MIPLEATYVYNLEAVQVHLMLMAGAMVAV
jgi:hypothetical protein